MPNLTVKNIPEDLYTHLKRYAKMNRRSLNSEIIMGVIPLTDPTRVNISYMLSCEWLFI